MELSGADQIVPLKDVLGRHLAVRSTTMGSFAHVVDSYDGLLFAEFPVLGPPLAGRTLSQSRLREDAGVSLIGIWRRGELVPATPDAVLEPRTILVFAGTAEQVDAAERLSGGHGEGELVLILGYGSVGRSAANFLRDNGVPHRLVDLAPPADAPPDISVKGDACDRGTLSRAGIAQATSVIVTTNDDGTNVFLTLVCRHLNPDLRIVARANREENVPELYAAGADMVVSLVSVGVTILLNALEGKATTFLTEGVNIFWSAVPPSLAGKSLTDSRLRPLTGATLVAVRGAPDAPLVPPRPDLRLEPDMQLLLVGSPEAEEKVVRLGMPAQRVRDRRGRRRAPPRWRDEAASRRDGHP
jgi:Trk K+ transport system NAD-binding subunit